MIDWSELAAPIPGFPGYWATPDGDVWSIRPRNTYRGPWRQKARKLASRAHPRRGYIRLDVFTGDGKKTVRRAAVVALTWIGARPEGTLVCHRDGWNTHDDVANLYYGTPTENLLDRHWHEAGNRGLPRPEVDPDDSSTYRDEVPDGLFEVGYDAELGF